MKSLHISYLLFFITGIFGGHRFYLEGVKSGLRMAFLMAFLLGFATLCQDEIFYGLAAGYYVLELFALSPRYSAQTGQEDHTRIFRTRKGTHLCRNIDMSYYLWAFGGFLGLHRFYLNNKLGGLVLLAVFCLIAGSTSFMVHWGDEIIRYHGYYFFYDGSLSMLQSYHIYPNRLGVQILCLLWAVDLFFLPRRFRNQKLRPEAELVTETNKD